MEHFYQHERFGENYFTYPTLYTNMIAEIPDGGSIVR